MHRLRVGDKGAAMRVGDADVPTKPCLDRRDFVKALGSACLMGAAALASGCSAQEAAETEAAATAESVSDRPSRTTVGEVPSSAKKFEQISTSLFVFDTVVTLMGCCSQETLDAAVARCEYFESIFSRTIETSDIGRINAAAGASVEVAPETADIITKALRYCEESDGRFDISIGVVTSLWDFKEGVVPEKDELVEAVEHVDYKKVLVDGTKVTLLDPEAKLDLGGIAKGYIADDLCKLFLDAGCDSGYVNLGGNVKTVGVKPDGRAWHVGIQDPNDEDGTVVAAVYSQDTSIVTSGLYERQFTKAGKTYWHIMDPKTGYPVETDLISATVVSDASLDGDGYTKPLFMMGHDEALAWLNAKPGIEGLVVGMDGVISQTTGCDAELV